MAQATLTQTVRVTNRYGYFFDSGSPDVTTGGTRQQIFDTLGQPGSDASLGVDYVGEATPDSFFFLHNDYCVGLCSVRSDTVITFFVTNNGPNTVALRFDSQITPGHLARFGNDPQVSTGFGFAVVEGTAGGTNTLYSASGRVTADTVDIDTSAQDFNNMLRFDNGLGGVVLDWSATNLNLELGRLLPNQSLSISYAASYYVNSYTQCADLTFGCAGSQVVFGDPRNTGGGGGGSSFARFATSAVGPIRDIVNREYDAYEVPFAFVESGSPLPGEPDPEPRLIYGRDFTPPDVPEPAIWMSMLAGFAMIGGAMRRRGVRFA